MTDRQNMCFEMLPQISPDPNLLSVCIHKMPASELLDTTVLPKLLQGTAYLASILIIVKIGTVRESGYDIVARFL